MFARLFGTPTVELTYFEKCSEFNSILPILAQLRKKKDELELEAQKNGAASLEFTKHTILKELLLNIDIKIREFNHAPICKHHEDEIKRMLELISRLVIIVNGTVTNDMDSLNTERDKKKEYTRKAISTAGVTGGAAAAILTGGGLLLVAGGMYLGLIASSATNIATGLTDLTTASAQMVAKLHETLLATAKNIKQYLDRTAVSLTKERVKHSRTWGAIALCLHPIFKELPNDMKNHILSFVTSGHEHETDLLMMAAHNTRLLATTAEMCVEYQARTKTL